MSFIKKYIDVKNNWVAFISSNEKYFYPGEYKFESQLRYIYLNDGENKKKAISMFGTNNQKFYKKMEEVNLMVVFSLSIYSEVTQQNYLHLIKLRL